MNIEVFKMKLNFVIILLIYFVLTVFAEQTDYCSIHSSHFLCSNRAPNRDPVVLKHYPDKDKEEITTIVELFNNFRSYRANGTEAGGDLDQNHGGNMLEMQWDEELATIAKMVASRRADDVKHFSFCCSCNILDRFESNALIRDYAGESEKIVWKDTLVKQLFIQMELRINPEHQKHIANLTMKFWLDDPFYLLVRAETYLVGCDLAIYKLDEQIRHRLVCIFGPVTSWIGEKVYDFGTPCSKCPASTECSSDNPSLCNFDLQRKEREQREVEAQEGVKGSITLEGNPDLIVINLNASTSVRTEESRDLPESFHRQVRTTHRKVSDEVRALTKSLKVTLHRKQSSPPRWLRACVMIAAQTGFDMLK